jgi:hypothetical protein
MNSEQNHFGNQKLKASHNNSCKVKVFDWVEAAAYIRFAKTIFGGDDFVVRAGLSKDWFATSAVIFENGKEVLDAHPYLSSIWDVPEIRINRRKFAYNKYCWTYDTSWASDTIWPKEALDCLYGPGELEKLVSPETKVLR